MWNAELHERVRSNMPANRFDARPIDSALRIPHSALGEGRSEDRSRREGRPRHGRHPRHRPRDRAGPGAGGRPRGCAGPRRRPRPGDRPGAGRRHGAGLRLRRRRRPAGGDGRRRRGAGFGRVDVLVNNAGTTRDNLLFRITEEGWNTVLDTNLKGAFLVTKQAARGMIKRRWGRIVNITSVVGIAGNKGQSNYTASKAGLIGFTKAVSKELASRNVLVNAVAPGFIDTELTRAVTGEAR